MVMQVMKSITLKGKADNVQHRRRLAALASVVCNLHDIPPSYLCPLVYGYDMDCLLRMGPLAVSCIAGNGLAAATINWCRPIIVNGRATGSSQMAIVWSFGSN